MSRLSTLLGVRRHATAGRAESNTPIDPAILPHPDDLLHDFAKSLASLDIDTSTHGARQAAAAPIHRLVEEALGTLRRQPNAVLSTAQVLGLETVIRADGTRPSLVIKNGGVDPDDPLARGWRDTLATTQAEVWRFARATARVQPRGGSAASYFGSGFLFNSEDALLITNRHVAGVALRKAIAPVRSRAPGGQVDVYRLYGDLIQCEFDGELDSEASACFAVREIALPPWPYRPDQPTLDVAVLRLERQADAQLPDALDIVPCPDFERSNVLTSICTVGFPATPRHRNRIIDGIDWSYVDKTLFGERYGIKRLAPGEIHRQVEQGEFGRFFAFGHDATTLGGCSGSGVFAWLDGAVAFGLHFFGAGADTNLAHGFGATETRTLLEELQILKPR
jgi:hypothetical protein